MRGQLPPNGAENTNSNINKSPTKQPKDLENQIPGSVSDNEVDDEGIDPFKRSSKLNRSIQDDSPTSSLKRVEAYADLSKEGGPVITKTEETPENSTSVAQQQEQEQHQPSPKLPDDPQIPNNQNIALINQRDPAVIIMAEQVKVKDAIATVPLFNGKNMNVEDFLETVTEAHDLIDQVKRPIFLKLVKLKIQGEARKSLKGATLNSVDELKKHLKQLYGTGLSLTALQGLLSRQIQQNGESVLTFANKIRDIGNEIIQKKEAEGALPPTFEASVKASQIECFKNGLIDEIALRLTNNDDISAIITEAVKIEKDLEIKRGMRQLLTKSCAICKRTNHSTDQCRMRRVNFTVQSNSNVHDNNASIRARPQCGYCKKPGHTIEKCFKRVYDEHNASNNSNSTLQNSKKQCAKYSGSEVNIISPYAIPNNADVSENNTFSLTGINSNKIETIGAQTNLININLLPSNIKINEKEKVSIEGIDQKPKVSYGKIKLSIFGMNIMFHVVDDSFNLPGDALLGAQFFHDNNAIINFKDLSLQLNNDKLKIEILNKDLGLDLSGKNNITPAELIYDFYNEPDDFVSIQPENHIPEFHVCSLKFNELKNLISTEGLDETEKSHALKIINDHKDIFHLPGETLPGTDRIQHRIITTDDRPIHVKQYKYPHALKDEVNRQIQEMLNNDVIEKSESPYNNPLWIVQKKPDAQGRINVNADCLSRNVPESQRDTAVCVVTRSTTEKTKILTDNSQTNITTSAETKSPPINEKGKPSKKLQKPKTPIPTRDKSKRQTKRTQRFDPSVYSKPPEPDPKSFKIPNSEPENSEESDEESQIEDEEEIKQIEETVIQEHSTDNSMVYSKTLMHCIDGNIAYFIDINGQPIDDGAKKLKEFNKLPKFSNISVGDASLFELSKRINHFALCIKDEKNIAPSTCKDNMKVALSKLRNLLEQRTIKMIFLTKSENILGLPWSEMAKILLLSCFISLVSATNLFLNEKIHKSPGIYFEKEENIRYYTKSWDIVIFFDCFNYHSLLPLAQVDLQKLRKTCQDTAMCNKTLHRASYVEDRIKSLEIQYSHLFTSLNNIEPRTPIDSLKTLARRSVPLGFIGSASKFLFGTLTEEDGLKYEQQIQDLSDKQLQLVKIAKDDSHLVHNKLNEMEEKMTNKWSDINASLKQLNKTAKDIYDLSSQWYRWSYETDANFVLNEIESLLNLFDDTLQSIHSIVTYCKVNLLHPDLVSSEQLHRIIRQIEDHDSDVEFPMPIMTARIEKLSNIASINMGFRDNKLIVKVTVPLLEKYPTFLYKMHSVPIPQELLTSRVSASIKPKSKYIAVNDHSNYYSLLNEENLHNCKEIGNRKICPKEHLMIEAHTEADCEYMLLHRPSIVNISNCDIILTHDSKDTWEFLSSINGWLYSVKNKESLLINCGEKQEYLQIQGIGILRIKPKCKATFRRMSINSFQGIGESIQFFYIPNIGINITHLDPNIPEKIAEILPALTRDNAFEDIKIPMQEIQNRYENLISNSRSNLIRNSITYTSVSTIAIICLVLSFGGYILFNLSKQHGYQLRTMNSKITGGMTVETPNHEIISHSEIPLQNAD
uniref:Uncharacterized protein n=1 Tax=Trichogramma kaykai TaxID=54128 RepID=A0ABD2W9U3_9HYME